MQLKTEFKHVYFERDDEDSTGKTSVWDCWNRSEERLGMVRWYAPWRQYCFYTNGDIILAKSCLLDIAEFCHDLRAYELEQRKEQAHA